MNGTKDEPTPIGYRDEAKWEEHHEHARRASELFWARLEELMEQKGVESIEELHERFLATGYRIPIPGRHRDKPVKLEEFKRHCARAYPSAEEPQLYIEFLIGLEEALELSEAETRDLFYLGMWGKLPSEA